MLRRVNLIILLGLIIVLVLSSGVSAGAQPENGGVEEAGIAQGDLLQNQDGLAQAQGEAAVAAERYNSARSQVDQLNRDIAETVLKQADAEESVKEAQASLEGQAVAVYKAGPLYLLDFLVGAESFSDFADRLWFAIKALLGMAEDVEAWKEESTNLEQIKVDLKANLQEQHDTANMAEEERAVAMNKADALRNQIDSIESSPDPLLPQDRIEAAEHLATGLDALADGPPEGSPGELVGPPGESAELPGESVEPVSFSPEAAEAIGIQEEDTSAIDEALRNAVQAGDQLQKAQNQETKASRDLVNELASSLDTPSGGAPQSTPLNNGGTPQSAPSNEVASSLDTPSGGAPQSAPSNNGGAPTTSLPSVTQSPEISKAMEKVEAAKKDAEQAKEAVENQSRDLARAIESAQQPAAGTPTNQTNSPNPANKATSDPKGNQTNSPDSAGQVGSQPKGSQPGTSATPGTAATPGTSATPSPAGGSALGAAAAKVGAPYLWGSDGPDAFSCTGLVRYALRAAGIDMDAPMDVGGYY
ncbi:MAG: hypothetical protein M3246_04950, partial [Actinomycetota bacterium]|nr:hypothetical protein [Actinomycetota bacterium]